MRLAVDAVTLAVEFGVGREFPGQIGVVHVDAAVQVTDLDVLALEPGVPGLWRTDFTQEPGRASGRTGGAEGHCAGHLYLEILEDLGHEGQQRHGAGLHRRHGQVDTLIQPQFSGFLAVDGLFQEPGGRAELGDLAVQLPAQVLEQGAAIPGVLHVETDDDAHRRLVTGLGAGEERRGERSGTGLAGRTEGKGDTQCRQYRAGSFHAA